MYFYQIRLKRKDVKRRQQKHQVLTLDLVVHAVLAPHMPDEVVKCAAVCNQLFGMKVTTSKKIPKSESIKNKNNKMDTARITQIRTYWQVAEVPWVHKIKWDINSNNIADHPIVHLISNKPLHLNAANEIEEPGDHNSATTKTIYICINIILVTHKNHSNCQH